MTCHYLGQIASEIQTKAYHKNVMFIASLLQTNELTNVAQTVADNIILCIDVGLIYNVNIVCLFDFMLFRRCSVLVCV